MIHIAGRKDMQAYRNFTFHKKKKKIQMLGNMNIAGSTQYAWIAYSYLPQPRDKEYASDRQDHVAQNPDTLMGEYIWYSGRMA